MSGDYKNLQVRRENIHKGEIQCLGVVSTLHIRIDSKAKNGLGTFVPHQHLLNERRQAFFHNSVTSGQIGFQFLLSRV